MKQMNADAPKRAWLNVVRKNLTAFGGMNATTILRFIFSGILTKAKVRCELYGGSLPASSELVSGKEQASDQSSGGQRSLLCSPISYR